MNATSRIAVLKFGGTSVATYDQREIAYRRIVDAREAGFATVAVISAMGRTPEPYATDSLLALVGGRTGDANADLLLATGELISAAVFASELAAQGVDAVAITGAQAGIVTDRRFGDARILRVSLASYWHCSSEAPFQSSPAFKVQRKMERLRRWAAAAPTFPRWRSDTRSARNASTSIPTSAER